MIELLVTNLQQDMHHRTHRGFLGAATLRFSSLLAMGVLCSGSLGAQTTWIVDSAGGGNFLAIQPAIDNPALCRGDRIEVRGPGPYAGFLVSGTPGLCGAGPCGQTKSLDIEATGGAVLTPRLIGALLQLGRCIGIRDVGQAESVWIAGFTTSGTPDSTKAAVRISNCDGSVFLSDIDATAAVWRGPGLSVEDCANVLLVDSQFAGTNPVGVATTHNGASFLRSQVAIQDCFFQGSPGRPSIGNFPPTKGGDGLVADDSPLTAYRSTFTGGPGGEQFSAVGPQASGGHGLVALSAQCVVTTILADNCALIPGAGGLPFGTAGDPFSSPCNIYYNFADDTVDLTVIDAVGAQVLSCGDPGAPNLICVPPLPTLSGPSTASPGSTVQLTASWPQSTEFTFAVATGNVYYELVIGGISLVPLLLDQPVPVAVALPDANGDVSWNFTVANDSCLTDEVFFFQTWGTDSAGASTFSSIVPVRIR